MASRQGHGSGLIEYTDAADRRLLVAPAEEADRLGLIRRVVGVVLRDPEGRCYIQRRAAQLPLFPGLWGLSAAGHVRVGEAREDAAARLLAEEAGVHDAQLAPLAVIGPDQGHSRYHLSLFWAGPAPFSPVPHPDRASEGLWVDRHELEGIATHFPDLLTPELLWAVLAKRLFGPPSRTERAAMAALMPRSGASVLSVRFRSGA